MGLWDRLNSWGDRMAGPSMPARKQDKDPRWARPLAFTIDIAPELRDAWQGTGARVAKVSREDALTVPAVKRVRDLIAATIGTLEFRELSPRNVGVDSDLLSQPEIDVPRGVSYTRIAEDLLFEERAWWRITEFDEFGWPRRVRRLEPRSVTIYQYGKVYISSETGRAQGQSLEWVPDSELIRFDSPCPGLLTYGSRTIRDCIALARAATRNVENPVPLGYFSPRDEVDPEDPPDIDAILDDWEDAVDRRAWPYLNAGLQANTLSWSPEQLQLGQARDAAILEVARMGGVDPEELGVSTTSRTYANAEQRRLDLIDFTIKPYVTAMQDRLSMGDVTFPGNKVRAGYEGFLRSDTLTRMQVYEIGRRVGVYDDKRIAEIEEIPSAKPQAPPSAAPAQPQGDQNMPASRTAAGAVQFADDTAPLHFGFNVAPDKVAFKADEKARTVSGMVLPWNVTARSGGYNWAFAPDSLHFSDTSRVKLDRDHGYGTEFGRAESLANGPDGLVGAFKVARGASGDDALQLAADGVYDGFSAFVTFDGEGDGWIPHPENDQVRYVQQATLRKVALTAMPAFDDARVLSVAATRKDTPVPDPVIPPAPVAGAPFDPVAFANALTAGMATVVGAAVADAIKNLPTPQGVPTRQVVPAGQGLQSVTEAPVYQMNGNGPSFVRDAWRSRTEGDHEARERLNKFQAQTMDTVHKAMENPEFAINTGNASQLVPPGFRPDLYVTQLMKGRPLTNSVSRGTLADATPFNIPAFVSSSGATADHVEGTNPTGGNMVLGVVTVTPGATSGLYQITREIADSANPAIDAIATQAMGESYSQQTEAKVYTELNGANGVGGTITAGFVPSGAQARTTTGSAGGIAAGGDELLAGVRLAMADYPFRRFAAPDFGFLSQEGTQSFATAVDSTGRPLLPWVGPMNAVGQADTLKQGYFVDGLTYQPAWSMSGNAAGDADVIIGNRNDVWCWESPLLMFRFEERNGPALIDLSLFGYFAVRVLRPVGLSGIRHTVTP